ncbi:MAG TPA: ATP-binding protein [Polyangiaceae bacterium]|nr:ATP-binding protein [Polyangiaceae bacterium]
MIESFWPRRPLTPRQASFVVVDDNADLAESLCELLGEVEVGCSATVASNAKLALELVERERYDVAFVDLHLPDAKGLDLATCLKAASPLLEVVIITGDVTLETAISAVRTSAFAYVVKPIRAEEFVDVARRALAQSRAFQEREELRQRIYESERRHRELVEAIPAFIVVMDREGRIRLWNRQLEETTGFSREEMLGEDGRLWVGFDSTDRRLPLKKGGHRLVRWQRVAASITDEPDLIYAMGTDVTDEREMMRRTLRAERLAAVGTMAAGLAHEVRNPLNSAQLQLDVLERKVAKGALRTETVISTSRILRDELRRLERLVEDFLSFAQPRPLSLEMCDVNQLIQSVVDLVAPEVHGAGIDMHVEFDPGVGVVEVEPQRLRQVLLNLLRNAKEAMVDHGTLTVRTQGPGTDGTVLIEICDTGPGFAEDAPIFDAFYTTKEGGTGLGLAIVHRIITDHGGAISVQGTSGDTRFRISLPQSTKA